MLFVLDIISHATLQKRQEKELAELFCDALQKENSIEQATLLHCLGDILLLNVYKPQTSLGSLVINTLNSASLYMLAMQRTVLPNQRTVLKQRLQMLEDFCLQKFKKQRQSSEPSDHATNSGITLFSNVEKWKKRFDKMRDFSVKRLKKIQDMWKHKFNAHDKNASRNPDYEVVKEGVNLAAKIKQDVRNIIKEIIQDCLSKLGSSTTKFAVLGVGDLALNFVTPYMDFEFIILAESLEHAQKEFFVYLTLLLHLRCIAFGETPLATTALHTLMNFETNWDVTSRYIIHGFKINVGRESSSISPFLFRFSNHIEECPDDVDLIKTPGEMVRFLYTLQDLQLFQFVNKLQQTILLHGDINLYNKYREMVAECFNFNTREPEARENMAIAHQLEYICGRFKADEQFYYLDSHCGNIGLAFEIIEDITLCTSLFSMLKSFYHVQAVNATGIAEEMKQKGFLSEEGEIDLKTLLSIAYVVYANCVGQAKGRRFGHGIFSTVDIFNCNVKTVTAVLGIFNMNILKRYYGIFLSLLDILKSQSAGMEKAPSLHKLNLPYYEAAQQHHIMYRLLLYKDAAEEGLIWLQKSKTSGTADQVVQKCVIVALMCIKASMHNEAHMLVDELLVRYDENATLKHLQGLLAFAQNEVVAAAQHLEKALALAKKSADHHTMQLVEKSKAVVFALSGQPHEVLKTLQQLTKVEKTKYSQNHIHWQCSLNLGLFCLPFMLQLGKFEAVVLFLNSIEKETSMINQQCSVWNLQWLLMNSKAQLGIGNKLLSDQYFKQAEKLALYFVPETINIPEACHSNSVDFYGINLLHTCVKSVSKNYKFHVKLANFFLQQTSTWARAKFDTDHQQTSFLLWEVQQVNSLLDVADSTSDYIFSTQFLLERALAQTNLVIGKREPNILKGSLLLKLGEHCLCLDEKERAGLNFKLAFQHFQKLSTTKLLLVPDFAETHKNLSKILSHNKQFEEAASHLEEAIQVSKKIYGRMHTKVAEKMQDMALLMDEMLEFDKCLQYNYFALDVFRQLPANDSNSVACAQIYHHMASVFEKLLEKEKAEYHYNKSLEIWKDLQPDDTDKQIILTLTALSELYSKNVRLVEALGYQRRAVQAASIVFSCKSVYYAQLLAKEAELLHLCEQFAESKVAFEEAVHIFETHKAAKSHSCQLQLANWLDDLSRVYRALEIRDLAVECSRRSLMLKEKHMGKIAANEDNLAMLQRLARLHEQKGDFKRAIRFRKQFLIKLTTKGAEGNASRVAALEALSSDYLALNEYEKALNYNKQLIDGLLEIHKTPEHAEVAQAYMSSGVIYEQMGRQNAAIESYKVAHDLYTKLGHTVNRGNSLTAVGRSMNRAGNLNCAETLHQAVNLLQSANLLGEEKKSLAQAYFDLGEAHEYHPQYENAVHYHMKGLLVLGTIAGCEAEISVSQEALGRSYCHLQQFSKGVTLLQQSLQGKISLGLSQTKPREYYISLMELGEHLIQAKQPQDALKYLQQAQAAAKEYLTDKPHLHKAKILGQMAYAHKMDNNRSQAIELAQKCMEVHRQVLKDVDNHPVYPEYTLLIADVHMDAQNYAMAVENYKKAAKLYLSLHHGNLLIKDVAASMKKLRTATTKLEEMMQPEESAE